MSWGLGQAALFGKIAVPYGHENILLLLIFLLSGWAILVLSWVFASAQQRQQLRIILAGTLLAELPLLCCTLLPWLFHWPLIIAGQWNVVSVIALPLAFAYAMIRYHIFVLDSLVRTVVAWIGGGLSLLLCAYFILGGAMALFGSQSPAINDCLVITMAIIGVPVWKGVQWWSQHFIFVEFEQSQALMGQLAKIMRDVHDPSLLTENIGKVMQVRVQAPLALFLLNEETQIYRRWYQWPEEDDVWKLFYTCYPPQIVDELAGFEWLAVTSPLVQKVCNTKIGLSVVVPVASESHASDQQHFLAIPIRQQEQVIGLVLLGPRPSNYTGPDIDTLLVVAQHLAYSLEQARRVWQAQYQEHRWVALFRAIRDRAVATTPATVACSYATCLATALSWDVAVWLREDGETMRQIFSWDGGKNVLPECLALAEFPQRAMFHSFDGVTSCASDLSWMDGKATSHAWAWLPLAEEGQEGEYHGAFLVQSSLPHHFSSKEQEVLQSIVLQCVSELRIAQLFQQLEEKRKKDEEMDRQASGVMDSFKRALTETYCAYEILRQSPMFPASLSPEGRMLRQEVVDQLSLLRSRLELFSEKSAEQ